MKKNWFYYVVVFVVGMIAGSLTFADSARGLHPQHSTVESR